MSLDHSSAVSLRRSPLDLRFRRARVAGIDVVTPRYRRLRLVGPDLEGFTSPGADDHVRLILPGPDGTLVLPHVDPDGNPALPEGVAPSPSREYTPVAWDPVAGALELDLVVHDGGLASGWVRDAQVGDEVGVGGPRGSQLVEGTPAWWLLVGDLTALPAVRRHAAAAGADAELDVVLLAPSPEDVQDVDLPPGARLRWVVDPACERGRTERLVEALHEWSVPGDPAAGFAFVAAEQSVVAPARRHLAAQGVVTSVVKGYWRTGDTEYHAPH